MESTPVLTPAEEPVFIQEDGVVVENVRVLESDDAQCILFNSHSRRISSRCPAVVGDVVRCLQSGMSLQEALASRGVPPEAQDRVAGIIRHVAGEGGGGRHSQPETSRDSFDKLVLCPTTDCPLRCVYCYGAAGARVTSRMSWALAKASIDYFAEHSRADIPLILIFHGSGEPIANFDVVKDAVAYTKRIGASLGRKVLCRLSTNGVYSTSKAEWVAREFDHVSLSLDGPPDIHNRQRPAKGGAGTYQQVIASMGIFHRANVLKRINVVITPGSVEHMTEIVRHLNGLGGVREVRFIPMSYCGRCKMSDVESLDMELFVARFDEALRLATALGIRIVSVAEQVSHFSEYYCGACGLNMCVSPDGRISTCHEVLSPHDPGADELLCGKYDRQTGSVIVEWEKIAALRTRTYKQFAACRACTFRTNCAGGCLARAARRNGTVMSIDEEWCHMVKHTLSKAFEALADGKPCL